MGAHPPAREPRHGAWGSRGEGQVPEIELSPRAKVAAIAAVLALVLFVLVAAREVLAPFAWAFAAAYVVHPSVAWLVRRTGLPRLAIVGALYVALLALLAFAIRGLVPGVQRELLELRLALPGLADALEPLNGRAAPVLGIQLEPHAVADALARATAAADLWVRDNAFGL